MAWQYYMSSHHSQPSVPTNPVCEVVNAVLMDSMTHLCVALIFTCCPAAALLYSSLIAAASSAVLLG